jgi:hypothetical protein
MVYVKLNIATHRDIKLEPERRTQLQVVPVQGEEDEDNESIIVEEDHDPLDYKMTTKTTKVVNFTTLSAAIM